MEKKNLKRTFLRLILRQLFSVVFSFIIHVEVCINILMKENEIENGKEKDREYFGIISPVIHSLWMWKAFKSSSSSPFSRKVSEVLPAFVNEILKIIIKVLRQASLKLCEFFFDCLNSI